MRRFVEMFNAETDPNSYGQHEAEHRLNRLKDQINQYASENGVIPVNVNIVNYHQARRDSAVVIFEEQDQVEIDIQPINPNLTIEDEIKKRSSSLSNLIGWLKVHRHKPASLLNNKVSKETESQIKKENAELLQLINPTCPIFGTLIYTHLLINWKSCAEQIKNLIETYKSQSQVKVIYYYDDELNLYVIRFNSNGIEITHEDRLIKENEIDDYFESISKQGEREHTDLKTHSDPAISVGSTPLFSDYKFDAVFAIRMMTFHEENNVLNRESQCTSNFLYRKNWYSTEYILSRKVEESRDEVRDKLTIATIQKVFRDTGHKIAFIDQNRLIYLPNYTKE